MPHSQDIRSHLLGTVILLFLFFQLAAAQTRELGTLIAQTAERAARVKPQRILLTPVQGCLLDPPLCAELDAGLREALQRAVPSLQFVDEQFVGKLLQAHGFLPIDVYMATALEFIADETGATVVMTEQVTWEPDGHELSIRLFDVGRRNVLGNFKVLVPRTKASLAADPFLFNYTGNGLSLIVGHDSRREFGDFRMPFCQYCPLPYTTDMRAIGRNPQVSLIATITERGILQDIKVVRGANETIANAALAAASTWRYRPALDLSGHAVPVRREIQLYINRPDYRPALP